MLTILLPLLYYVGSRFLKGHKMLGGSLWISLYLSHNWPLFVLYHIFEKSVSPFHLCINISFIDYIIETRGIRKSVQMLANCFGHMLDIQESICCLSRIISFLLSVILFFGRWQLIFVFSNGQRTLVGDLFGLLSAITYGLFTG